MKRMPRMHAPLPPVTERPARTKLEVAGLDVFYGNFQAVKNASLSVPENSVMALIGPSGCGKSTFIRALNRMHDLTPEARVEGRVSLDGSDIYAPDVDPEAIRYRIGMVFQRPNPFPKSIFDNVVYGPQIHGVRDKSASLRSRSKACGKRRCGTKSKTGSIVPRSISRAGSSSGCASRAASR